MTPDIVVTDTPSAEDRKAVLDGLIAFNEANAGPHGWRPFPGVWGLKGLPITFTQG